MKNSALEILAPAIASSILIASLGILLFSPLPSPRLYRLPVARNGACYSFGTMTTLVHVTIFRDGSIASGRDPVVGTEVFDLLTAARQIDKSQRLALRIAVHPDAPASAIRSVYDAGLRAQIDALFFRVTTTQKPT